MKRLTYSQTLEVLDRYGTRVSAMDRTVFYKLHTDLPAFKKAYYNEGLWKCIINLIIPVGTIIHVGNQERFSKCRAEKAFVHSIFDMDDGTQPVKTAQSSADAAFKYAPGRTVRPTNPFSREHSVCESGIHFFIDIKATLAYPI